MTSVGSWRQGRRVCTPSWLVPTQEPPTQSRGEASAWPPGAAQASAAVALPPGPAVGGVCAQRVRVCVLCRPACSRTCVCVGGVGVLGGGKRGCAGWGARRRPGRSDAVGAGTQVCRRRWQGRAGELGRRPKERLRIAERGAWVFVLEGSLAADPWADQRGSWPESLEAPARRLVPGLLCPHWGTHHRCRVEARRGFQAEAREQPCHACPGQEQREPTLVLRGPRAPSSPAPAVPPLHATSGASAQATPATHPLSDARSQVISYFRMVFFFTLKQSPSFRTAPCFPSPHTPGRQSLSYIVISIYTVWGRFLQRVLFCF